MTREALLVLRSKWSRMRLSHEHRCTFVTSPGIHSSGASRGGDCATQSSVIISDDQRWQDQLYCELFEDAPPDFVGGSSKFSLLLPSSTISCVMSKSRSPPAIFATNPAECDWITTVATETAFLETASARVVASLDSHTLTRKAYRAGVCRVVAVRISSNFRQYSVVH